MKRFVFGLLLLNSVVSYSQDDVFNLSVEFEYKIVPLLFHEDLGLFFKQKLINKNNSVYIENKKILFKGNYSLKLNFILPKKNNTISASLNYSKVGFKGKWVNLNDSTNFWIASSKHSNYFGADIRYLTRIEKTEKFEVQQGVNLGFGILESSNSKISMAEKKTSQYSQSYSKEGSTEVEVPFVYDLGFVPKVKDIYLNYSFLIEYDLLPNIGVYVGVEVPIIRLFFYNDKAFVPGVSLNTESFFTGFNSYALDTRNSESFNKNVAYSLKKHHATSLNLGIRFYL